MQSVELRKYMYIAAASSETVGALK